MNKEEVLSDEFRRLFDKIAWLNKQEMEKIFKGYTSTEIHCLEKLYDENLNVTELACSLYMTKGAISKLTKKMLRKEIILSYQKKDNQKEVYFKLTKKGKILAEKHEFLHNKYLKRDKVVFDTLTNKQFQDILSFISKYNKHIEQEILKINLSK